MGKEGFEITNGNQLNDWHGMSVKLLDNGAFQMEAGFGIRKLPKVKALRSFYEPYECAMMSK